jgi:hypothetical protein
MAMRRATQGVGAVAILLAVLAPSVTGFSSYGDRHGQLRQVHAPPAPLSSKGPVRARASMRVSSAATWVLSLLGMNRPFSQQRVSSNGPGSWDQSRCFRGASVTAVARLELA